MKAQRVQTKAKTMEALLSEAGIVQGQKFQKEPIIVYPDRNPANAMQLLALVQKFNKKS